MGRAEGAPRSGWGRRAVIVAGLLAATGSGCIDYFAEPPALPAIASDAAAAEPDAGPDRDADPARDARPDADAEVDAAAHPDAEPELDATRDHDAEAEPDAARDPDPRPDAEVDAQPDALPRCVPAAESCNGLDDDCDGRTDEDVDDDPPGVRGGLGICADAAMVCVRGGWQPLAPEALPDGEREETRCDLLDNDCDGRVDEELADCTCRRDADGTPRCEWGCDGVDHDGDGRSDEGCTIVVCGAERRGHHEVPPCNGCPDGTRVREGWVCIPAGEFTMGSPPDEAGHRDDEGPERRVRISRPFLMTRTEVTREDWRLTLGDPPAPSPRAAGPVIWVNWCDAVAFAQALSQGLRDAGDADIVSCYATEGCDVRPEGDTTCDVVDPVPDCTGIRLPTEAEWEYAARAGTSTRYWTDDATLGDVAHYDPDGGNDEALEDAEGRRPNPWGLVGVHGNASEWVEDGYAPYAPAPEGEVVVDPRGWAPVTCTQMAGDAPRVTRGGSFLSDADGIRAAARVAVAPDFQWISLGFRVVQPLP